MHDSIVLLSTASKYIVDNAYIITPLTANIKIYVVHTQRPNDARTKDITYTHNRTACKNDKRRGRGHSYNCLVEDKPSLGKGQSIVHKKICKSCTPYKTVGEATTDKTHVKCYQDSNELGGYKQQCEVSLQCCTTQTSTFAAFFKPHSDVSKCSVHYKRIIYTDEGDRH